MGKSGLSPAQLRTLFAAVRLAARELGEEPEAYRKRVMREELDVEHLSDVSGGSGFDILMARFCRDSGDYERAIKYSISSVSRYRHLIVSMADKIAPGDVCEYIAGVMIQSHTVRDVNPSVLAARLKGDSGWLDFTIPQLQRLLAMLSTHLRRLSR